MTLTDLIFLILAWLFLSERLLQSELS